MKNEAFKKALSAKKRDRFEVRHGDNLQILKSLNPNQFDSLVTDPPAGIAFMGKDWDTDKGGRDHWIAWLTEVLKECYRVMKPGAYGLVWALPRTSHWTAMACEDAGFQIRDCIMHMFGSGFPKSHDISKAIDKQAGVDHLRPKVAENPSYNPEATIGPTGWVTTARPEFKTAGYSDEAKRWNGWGTALKPAYEPWWLIQKPIDEDTIAENVLKHGVGGLNIDASRIATTDNLNGGTYSKGAKEIRESQVPGNGIDREFVQPEGRFPANILFDEAAAAVLDEQSGKLSPGHFPKRSKGNPFGPGVERDREEFYTGSGGASRFFYVAKASKSDKGDDNGHPTVKSTALMEYLIKLVTRPGGTILDPFMGSGTTGVSAIRNDFKFFGIDQEQKYTKIALDRMLAEYKVTPEKLRRG